MFKGIIAPNLTFFKKGGEVDEELCRGHMRFMLEKGVNGLFVTGTYGSGYLMSQEERILLYKIAVEEARMHKDAFVIGHVGCPSTASSLTLTRAACELELDAISAIEPYQYPYTVEERVDYYKALVEASAIPVLAYNNPELTGMTITPSILKKLRAAGIGGIKDSSINLKLAAEVYSQNKLTDESFQYISGTTTGWIGLQKLGVSSMIAGMCNYIPELAVALYRYSLKDEEKALAVYQLTMGLSDKLKEGNSLASSHMALAARGIDAGHMRLPLKVDYEGRKDRIREMKVFMDDALEQLKVI